MKSLDRRTRIAIALSAVLVAGLACSLLRVRATYRPELEVTLPLIDAVPPVGTILPYMGPKDRLPPGWILCDGTSLNEANGFKRDGVDPYWWGKPVPNLTGRFLRGRTKDEVMANTAGSDMIPEHRTVKDGGHIHHIQDPDRGVEGYSNEMAQGGPAWDVANKKADIVNPFGAYADGHSNLISNGEHKDQYNRGHGQHRHVLGKLKDGKYSANAKSAGTISTQNDEGKHTHNIVTIAFVPSYVATDFIIRIK